jgi:protoporphyrinogen oxidase
MDLPPVVIGAGPAGLAAAFELGKRGLGSIILEKAGQVGGLARTELYRGYRFDIGGHRFYTRYPEIQQLWEEILGEDFLEVPRLSRLYYQNRFFKYPLDVFDTLANLGVSESVAILASYIQALLLPFPHEDNLEQWLINRFGRRLYETFFKSYTEKVWGLPCHEIQADWAAQRIKGLSLRSALANALWGTNHVKTLITAFRYPALGPMQMWSGLKREAEKLGAQVELNSRVIRLAHRAGEIQGLTVQRGEQESHISSKRFISTMPLTELITRLDPPPPPHVVDAAGQLRYRDFILVGLIVNRAELFPDNWIYVHSPETKVGRIQNFKNWSPAMVPDPQKTSLGMEFFCAVGDELWAKSDQDLIRLATQELALLGLADAGEVEDGVVFRQAKAYPVYSQGYQEHLQVIQDYLATFVNLQSIGRNGMHRYNNMDHSMLAGIAAARNLQLGTANLWNLKMPGSHHEEVGTSG